jgi:hypothetical protein
MFRMIHSDVERDLQPDRDGHHREEVQGRLRCMGRSPVQATSVLTDRARLNAFLAKPTLKVLEKDLGFQAAEIAA